MEDLQAIEGNPSWHYYWVGVNYSSGRKIIKLYIAFTGCDTFFNHLLKQYHNADIDSMEEYTELYGYYIVTDYITENTWLLEQNGNSIQMVDTPNGVVSYGEDETGELFLATLSGGIYEVRDPDLNMCFPPLTWQTYDIDFTAPRFGADGAKTSEAKLTVRLNGVAVQRETSVSGPTRGAIFKDESSSGPIYIQNHKNPVRFRNIWLLPK